MSNVVPLYVTQRRVDIPDGLEDRQGRETDQQRQDRVSSYLDWREDLQENSINQFVRATDFPDSFASGIMRDSVFRRNVEANKTDRETPYVGAELVWSITNSRFEMVVWSTVDIIRIQEIAREDVNIVHEGIQS